MNLIREKGFLMTKTRKTIKIVSSIPTLEGAGVHLQRVFGFGQTDLFDPFLLLDDFRSDFPDHYLKGFPWHPHRGIETITYVLSGDVEHGDSLGNKGIIGSGDVQWMTAGSGIIHQEMPQGDKTGRMYGFQLWANLPARDKMMDPRYRDVQSEQIPEVAVSGNATVKIIAGEVEGVKGPVGDIVIDPEYIDVALPPHSQFRHPTKRGHTAFAYIIDGTGNFCGKSGITNRHLALFDDGDEITVSTDDRNVRFLFISGRPLNEPVAWYGPIVMNTQEELQLAFEEYERGTFIKSKK